jgi:hypothetical protein
MMHALETKEVLFPSRCARCGAAEQGGHWAIHCTNSFGGLVFRYDFTQSINVPICVPCRAALGRRGRACVLLALLGGMLFGLGLWWSASWIGGSTTTAWIAPVVNGLVFGCFLAFGLGEVAGLRFARYARGGWKIYFADAQYQQEFDHVNGLPTDEMSHELTVRERLAMLGFGMGLLFVVSLLGSVAFGSKGPGTEFYPGALLALAITAVAAGFAGITGKGKTFAKWVLRSASHAELQKGHKHLVEILEEGGMREEGTPLSTLYKLEKTPLSPAVGWGIFLGFLAVALAVVVWLALRG